MPYSAIKGFPKDDGTMHEVAERINAVLLDLWGCRQEHINISYGAVPPEEWDEEKRQSEAASRFTDYYYVPTIYAHGQKFYEAHPGDDYATIKAEVKKALDTVV